MLLSLNYSREVVWTKLLLFLTYGFEETAFKALLRLSVTLLHSSVETKRTKYGFRSAEDGSRSEARVGCLQWRSFFSQFMSEFTEKALSTSRVRRPARRLNLFN
jgi:hypothetical protein